MKLRALILVSALAAVLCALLMLVSSGGTGAAAQGFATLPPFVTATQGPIPTFTLAATTTPRSGCSAPLNLGIGRFILVRGGLNVRVSPSQSAPLVTYFSEERRVQLIGGSVCSEGYNWWQIGSFGGEVGAETGWVIEGRDGLYYLSPGDFPPGEPCFSPLPFAVGDPVRAVTGVRVRNAPSLSAYTITVVPIDGLIDILEGPGCFNGINWWRVRAGYQTSGIPIEGWVAEGFPDNYWLQGLDSVTGQTAIPCVLPLTLRPGSRIAVNYRDGVPRRLRDAPSVGAALILELPDEIALQVLDGPVCSGGYNWWQVQVISTSFIGWIAEGRPGIGGYNIEIISR